MHRNPACLGRTLIFFLLSRLSSKDGKERLRGARRNAVFVIVSDSKEAFFEGIYGWKRIDFKVMGLGGLRRTDTEKVVAFSIYQKATDRGGESSVIYFC